jgi:hypothetical protein
MFYHGNNIQFKQKLYKQIYVLAMGAHTPAIFSEIFLQHLEDNYIIHILHRPHINGYYRYAENILTTHNKQTTKIQYTLEEFNSIHNTLKFTVRPGKERKLNFLDITLINQGNKIEFDIYRKPATTDHCIHRSSYHLLEHILAGIRCFINRMKTYSVSNSNKQKEKDRTDIILRNNNYPPNLINTTPKKPQNTSHITSIQPKHLHLRFHLHLQIYRIKN